MTTISGLGNLADALQKLQETFKKADTDGNGKLSEAEMATALGDIAKSTGTDAKTVFAQMDKDGDGQLTKEELTEGVKLTDKVREALLLAQDIKSGSLLIQMMGGGSGSTSSAAGMFSSGAESSFASASGTEDTASADPYTTLLEQMIAKYKEAETEAAAAEKPAPTVKDA